VGTRLGDAKVPWPVLLLRVPGLAPDQAGKLTVIGAVAKKAIFRAALCTYATITAPKWAIIGEPSGWERVTLGYKAAWGELHGQPPGLPTPAPVVQTPAELAVDYWNRLVALSAGFNAGRSALSTRSPLL